MLAWAQIKFTWGHFGLVCIFLLSVTGHPCVPGTIGSLAEDAVSSLLPGDLFLVVEKNRNKMEELKVIEWYWTVISADR